MEENWFSYFSNEDASDHHVCHPTSIDWLSTSWVALVPGAEEKAGMNKPKSGQPPAQSLYPSGKIFYNILPDFPGGPVVKNWPANAERICLLPVGHPRVPCRGATKPESAATAEAHAPQSRGLSVAAKDPACPNQVLIQPMH